QAHRIKSAWHRVQCRGMAACIISERGLVFLHVQRAPEDRQIVTLRCRWIVAGIGDRHGMAFRFKLFLHVSRDLARLSFSGAVYDQDLHDACVLRSQSCATQNGNEEHPSGDLTVWDVAGSKRYRKKDLLKPSSILEKTVVSY